MKILKDNFNEAKNFCTNIEPYPRSIICEMCGSELEYEKSDMRMGMYGCMHIDCPLCGYSNMIEDNENNIKLTKENIEFPTHFNHICKEYGAVEYCNNENVKKHICEAIDYFRNNKDEYTYGCWITGNLYLDVSKDNENKDYYIMVSDNFYVTSIPFENKDY